MDKSETEKQAAMRQAEKERYLASLKSREVDRQKTRDQSKDAERNKGEHASKGAQNYLDKMGSRSEFRSNVRDKMIADSKENQDSADAQGQEYRGKLQWFSNRYLMKPEDIDRILDNESGEQT